MYLDFESQLSAGQPIGAGTVISANVIDLFAATGGGTALTGDPVTTLTAGSILVAVTTAFTGSGTLTVTLESADNAGLSTNATVHFSTGAIDVSTIAAGDRLVSAPLPGGEFRRYLGLRYTATGSAAGAVSAHAVLDPAGSARPYPKAFTV